MSAGILALILAGFSGGLSVEWPLAVVAAVLFLISASIVLWLAVRPVIEIHEKRLVVGRRAIPWPDIRRVDRTGWISPLVVHLTLANQSRVLVVYSGDLESSTKLLRHIRRMAREALIDGVPYRQFWGEVSPAPAPPKALPSPRYRLLRDEDEADVERLYQLLKTVGHIDSKNPSEEN